MDSRSFWARVSGLCKNALLGGGGYGASPLLFLANELIKKGLNVSGFSWCAI